MSKDQLAILRAIRSGRNSDGAGASEKELAELFPARVHLLRQLNAEGYADAYTAKASDVRIYQGTEKVEAAVRDAAE